MAIDYRLAQRGIMVVMCIVLWRVCNFADTITVKDFGDYQVFQRSIGGASAPVSVSGTYLGDDVDNIQAMVANFIDGSTIMDWQTIAPVLSGGTYSGPIVVPQGGWYKIAVRGRNASGSEVCQNTGAHRWGVGINVLCIGQSNMVGNGNIRSNYTIVKTDLAGLYSNSNAWKKLSDPYDSGGSPSEVDYDSWYGASMIPSFANSLADAFPTIPIGIVPAAKGGTPLHGTADTCWITRDPANHANPQNLYGNSIANARAVGGVELIIMHQGETDATNNASEAQYMADFDTLVAYYRQDLYSSVPLFFCQLGSSFTDTLTKHRTDSTMQRIRNAQHDLDGSANKVYLSALCIDLPVATGDDHYTKPGHDTIGGRLANAVKFYYGAQTYNPPYYRGPEITAASFADSNRKLIDVAIAHRGGNDFTPLNNITGFQVTSGADTVAISSAVRQSASTIRLTLAKAITGSAAVRYLVGKHPNVSGAVHDNTPLRLPLEPTTFAINVPHINTLSIAIAGRGTVTKDPDRAFYLDGSTVHLTALPQTGYHFMGWSGDLTSTNSDTTIILTANRSIIATFAITQFSLTLTSTNGTVAKVPSQTLYDSNTVVQLTATPNTGYTFSGWSGDAAGSTNPIGVTMNGNKSITAIFTITAIPQYSLTLISTNGTIAKSPSQTLYDSNTVVQLTATPNAGYTFSGWSGDASGVANPLGMTMSGNKNVTASFLINQYSITLTSTNGTVTKIPDQPSYPYGSAVRLTAAPQNGFHFLGWGGDLTGVTADTTIILAANRSITATFALDTCALSITVVGNGAVTKNPAQPYPYGSMVSLTATPQTGYRFVGWSGDLSDTTNPVQIMMNGAKSVTATFTLDAPHNPTLKSPSDGVTGQPLSLSLLWNKTDLTETYHVQVANGSAFASVFKEDSSLTDTSFALSGLANSMRYFWHVRTKNAGGVSAWSLPWSFTTIVAIPAAVTLVSPAKGDTVVADSARLVWRKPDSTVTRYWLEIGVDSAMTNAKTDSLPDDTAEVVKSLINKRTYWWRVRACNAAGWGAFSEKNYFSVALPYVEALPEHFQLSLHSLCLRGPDGVIRYSLPRQSRVSMRIYDLQGKLVLSLVNSYQPAGFYSLSFDRQSFPVGRYIFWFKAGAFEVKKLFLLMR